MSVNNALVRFVYPRDQLGRGVAINALVGAISSAIGPSVAAAILSVAPWQWLFAINVPLGGIALALIMGALPRTPVAHHRFDWLSAVMSAATFGMLITGIDNLRRLSVFVALELSGAAVAAALFVWRQLLLPYPMLAVELFARPVFALSVVTSICSFTAQNLAFVSLPFFLEEVLGRSPVETGLLMTPWPVAVGFVAPIAGWLADKKYPVGILGGMGLATMTWAFFCSPFGPVMRRFLKWPGGWRSAGSGSASFNRPTTAQSWQALRPIAPAAPVAFLPPHGSSGRPSAQLWSA